MVTSSTGCSGIVTTSYFLLFLAFLLLFLSQIPKGGSKELTITKSIYIRRKEK
jgi:hypothetical protein